jgi:hypothetical protein
MRSRDVIMLVGGAAATVASLPIVAQAQSGMTLEARYLEACTKQSGYGTAQGREFCRCSFGVAKQMATEKQIEMTVVMAEGDMAGVVRLRRTLSSEDMARYYALAESLDPVIQQRCGEP